VKLAGCVNGSSGCMRSSIQCSSKPLDPQPSQPTCQAPRRLISQGDLEDSPTSLLLAPYNVVVGAPASLSWDRRSGSEASRCPR